MSEPIEKKAALALANSIKGYHGALQVAVDFIVSLKGTEYETDAADALNSINTKLKGDNDNK